MAPNDPPQPGLDFSLSSGLSGRVVACAGLLVTLESPEPAPPGSTVRARLEDLTSPLEVKVRSCKRRQEGPFVIEGRLQNARKDLLERLARLGPAAS